MKMRRKLKSKNLSSLSLNKTLKFDLAECSFSYMVTYLRQQIKVPSLQNPGWPPNTIQIWTCRILHDLLIHSPTRRLLGSLCTQDWEPMTITLQALSLVEKAELVQVRFILRLRDLRSMWMQDECKVYVNSSMASNGSCSMVTWTIFKFHLWEGL